MTRVSNTNQVDERCDWPIKRPIPQRVNTKVTGILHATATAGGAPSLEACQAQTERLAASQLFQASEALTKLFRYLAQHSLTEPATHLKEYQIATEVLGRSADFDPQTDSSIRVQMGRLRGKLAEYYESAGANDPIVVKIPKGCYTLVFEPKILTPKLVEAISAPTPKQAASKPMRAVALAAVITFLLTAGGLLYHYRGNAAWPYTAHAATAATTSPLTTLWAPLFHDSAGPYVVYSNAAFVGSPRSGMRYYDPKRDSDRDVEQHYTGVGELVGAVRLVQMFDRAGWQLRLKRAGLFTLDEALNNDLVFLGSPTENTPLARVTATHEFAFGQVPGKKSGEWGFIPAHPRPGDPAAYFATPPTVPFSEDYAVVALVPGLTQSRRILILEGISTLSTEAAVEFACDERSVSALLKKLAVKPGSTVPPFEALIRVKVASDVPIEMQLVDARRTSN